ncbi:hypothetical protein A3759_15210 [Thalassolituus sp. HI0120]|nr:hypothetical protein A3759_15210 [Thalassolituus sp. HI0120]
MKPNFGPNLNTMNRWLCHNPVTKLAEDCLYAYDGYLDAWYQSAPKNEDYFETKRGKRQIAIIEKALYRLHHYNVEEDTSPARKRFVLLMREILDNREFIPQLKQMWLDVKEGKIQVEDAWRL